MIDHDRTAALMTPAMLAQLRMKPKPDAPPAAWLNQMASDAGSGHVRRLVELHQQLVEHARGRHPKDVQASLKALHEAAAAIDFTRVQPRGWLARATGRGKDEAAGFAPQFGRAEQSAEELKESIHELRKRHQIATAAMERALAELTLEVEAIEKILDQGARWLQDMRNQLRTRQMQAPDEAAQLQIQEDGKRCDLLVARMKQLRGINSAAQHARELCQVATGRHVNFLQLLQQLVETELQAWQDQLAPIAEAVRAGRAPDAGLDDAQAANQRLDIGVDQAIRDCKQLAGQQDAFVEELAVLAQPLAAAA